MLTWHAPTPTLPRPRGRELDLLVPNAPTLALTHGRRLLVGSAPSPGSSSGQAPTLPRSEDMELQLLSHMHGWQRVIYLLPGVQQVLTTYAHEAGLGAPSPAGRKVLSTSGTRRRLGAASPAGWKELCTSGTRRWLGAASPAGRKELSVSATRRWLGAPSPAGGGGPGWGCFDSAMPYEPASISSSQATAIISI